MRSLRGQGAALYDSPYETAFYGAASGKSYFGRGYPPMTFNPIVSPAVAASPFTGNMYNAGGYSRESFGRAMGSPQRRMDPFTNVGASPFSSGGSPYAAAAAAAGSYFLERDKLMGSYFGAGYSQLPLSFGPSRDYSRESSSVSTDRKHPSSISGSRGYHKR